jgi:hypothetical protein
MINRYFKHILFSCSSNKIRIKLMNSEALQIVDTQVILDDQTTKVRGYTAFSAPLLKKDLLMTSNIEKQL